MNYEGVYLLRVLHDIEWKTWKRFYLRSVSLEGLEEAPTYRHAQYHYLRPSWKMSSRSRVATHVIRKWFLWHFERCWIISKGQMCLNSSGSHTHACRNSSQKNSFYAGWIPTGGHVFDDEFFSTVPPVWISTCVWFPSHIYP